MPGRDGTGPQGQGAMTGRGLGVADRRQGNEVAPQGQGRGMGQRTQFNNGCGARAGRGQGLGRGRGMR